MELFPEIKLYCPRCASRLILGTGTRIYETLIDHVCNSNIGPIEQMYYICSNDQCLTRKTECFWDELGDIYTGRDINLDVFIMGMPQAINSCMRESKLSQKVKVITWLHLYWLKFEIEFSPIPRKPGADIDGYKIKFIILRKTLLGWEVYTPGIRMLFYCINKFFYARKRYKEDPEIPWAKKDMIESLERPSWDKRWWVRLSVWILNLLYPNLKEQLKRL